MLFNKIKGLIKARRFEAPFVDNWVIQGDMLRSLNTASLNPHLAALHECITSVALSASPGRTFLDDLVKFLLPWENSDIF